ncbi:nitrite reductase (NAD(P)H) small subunit family protein [Salinicola sp. CR57]|uniref:nitrite reductase (NAD(P)H) small subunit family protein n=1 Tax=Salinicola sp. CR57 TaxID=1949086 RepID=UPI000DA187BF|nr:nitrite reductase (NAD(P)H) small subunit family protein [Salinicola sp. CR57]
MSGTAIAPGIEAGVRLCSRQDLVANSGIVAWHQGHQIAIFLLAHPPGSAGQVPPESPEVAGAPFASPITSDGLYALDNRDPFSGTNVIGRGIVGDLGGELVVASPIYKQHFRLRDGQCLEAPDQRLRCWPVALEGDDVVLLPEETFGRT